jgi:hypothetical protein
VIPFDCVECEFCIRLDDQAQFQWPWTPTSLDPPIPRHIHSECLYRLRLEAVATKFCEIAIVLIEKLDFKDDHGIKGNAPIPQHSLVPKFVVGLKVSIILRFPKFNDRRDATFRGEAEFAADDSRTTPHHRSQNNGHLVTDLLAQQRRAA